ncbi:HAD-IIA family hydrolase [Paenibacillus sp. HN-1]|uniref:HAD-IIA family hydrolase n=1 Tax=Paenibacillus TaxID=44249 RepID=UPI001CA9B3B3|nr:MULTISPECIES: HAD-IIA family hydrolase [Paenibacillus]MBY9078164.1 HAD-IIA family hydrolase [Paenibacillus sp. CGMCC 1.18879]MBY9083905.1 HAD-IIA family hydrolase [Paenibacillus sinensis]
MLSYETYFFDLDGTVFIGDALLPGVQKTLFHLRSLDKQLRFLSNTAIRTRAECRDRLEMLGLTADINEIVTAGYVSAVYFRELNGPVRVLVSGERALRFELESEGVVVTDDPLEATHVLVGMDREFTYDKLHRAMRAVRAGAALIAANPDPCCPVADDLLPDTWSMVKAIEAAGGAQVQEIIGKPSAYYAAKVLEWSGAQSERCLMIGDRLDTDILFGASHGMRTALVLSGVTSLDELAAYHIQPDYVWHSLDELLSLVAGNNTPI